MKILIAGDFCPQQRVAELFDNGDFVSVLGDVKPIIEQTDYSIINFECPICKGDEKPISKQGRNLKCTEKGIEAVKWCGFNCVTLANNHFLDFGEEGVDNTLAACGKYGIDTVGGGNNLNEASHILYKEIGSKKLAILNCCEHEFSIATGETAGSNPLNPIQQYYAIQEAKNNADYVLVIVHGGHEHYQLPSPRMQETYRFFVDAGADAVVNHHQHCFSGYETYKDKPIFYGLGNFCFDRGASMPDIWCEGYMLELLFENAKISYNVYPYRQCDKEPCVQMLPIDSFNESFYKLNQIIAVRVELKLAIAKYYKDSIKNSRSIFEPVRNRYILAAQQRGWLPSFITQKWKTLLQNYIFCESHRDKIKYYFEY